MKSAYITLAYAAVYLFVTPAFFTGTATIDDANFYFLPYLRLGDPIEDISKHIAPLGYEGMMWALTNFIHPIVAGRVMQLLQVLLYLYWCVRIGQDHEDWPLVGAFTAGAMALSNSWLVGMFAGGVPHGFAPGMFAMVIHGAFHRDRQTLAWAALLGSLCVPQAMAVAGLFSLVFWWQETIREPRMYLALTLALAASVGFAATQIADIDEVTEMPEFRPGGRGDLAILPDVTTSLASSLSAPFEENRKSFRILLDERKEKAGLVMAFLRGWYSIVEWQHRHGFVTVAYWLLWTVLPAVMLFEVWPFILCCWCCYLVATIVAYKLYVPAMFWSYPAAVLVSMSPFLAGVYRSRSRMIAGLVTFWLLAGPGIRPNIGFNWGLWDEQCGLFEFAKTTDPADVWAGPPHDAATVGLSMYAGRKTLISWETAVAWRIGTYQTLCVPRIRELIDVYWNGAQPKGFRYLIVRTSDLRDPSTHPSRWIFEPFKVPVNWISPYWRREDRLVYRDSTYFVLDLKEDRGKRS